MGASFLCAYSGIENKVIENQTAYISHWLTKLRNDKKLLVQASAQAQKAVDYLLQLKFEDQKEKE